MTGKIMPLRERDTSTIQAAADALAGACVVPDNRPLSGRFTGRSLLRETGQQLADRSRESQSVDGDVRPGRSDDDVAVNGNSRYRFG